MSALGSKLFAGQEIGLVGASGSAIGSHLHFEVRYGQNTYFSTRNPELWFAPLEGAGALAGRIYDPDYPQVRGAVRIQRMEDGKITDSPPTSRWTFTRPNWSSKTAKILP
jgi:murein DD-endopeptidase MepM/ murein hydrolase activator NlpD